jgi:hypothetical protein
MKLNYLFQPKTTCDGCKNLNNTAIISWAVDDIQVLRPNATPEERAEMLEVVSRALVEGSIEYGWEILSTALDIHYPEED